MIYRDYRRKGGGADVVGARGPGQRGPFGPWGSDGDEQESDAAQEPQGEGGTLEGAKPL